jgi:hypothetical protein
LNDPLSNSALTAETSSSLQAIAADGKRSLESINASRESGLQSSIPVLYRSASSCNNELLLQIDSTISNSQSSLVKSLASQFSCLSTTYNSSTAAAAVSSKFTPSFPTFVSQKQHISLPPNTASTNTNTTSTASKPPAFKRFTQIPQPSLSLPPSLVMISNNTINSTDMFRRPSLILSQLPFSPVRDLLASNEAKAMDRRLVNTTNKVNAHQQI